MVECEFCGQQIAGKTYRVTIEGVTLVVCHRCFLRLISRSRVKQQPSYIMQRARSSIQPSLGVRQKRVKASGVVRRTIEFDYEIVEDYAERIRRAREALGWSTSILAQKIKEKESVVRRIEAGKLKPTIELAKKLEKILKITLLEPIVPEYTTKLGPKESLTLGDIVVLRKKKGG
ncbi:MAG: TIGR00270 family protein [Desulfurococcales archaeon ex4484_217_2]|nr:MAG: TIGR00270 family protein [Desulfurococcales archaeon ex4484_217_2]